MKKIAARTALLLAGVVVLLSAWALTGALNDGDGASSPADQEQSDSQWREQGLSAPPGAIVHDVEEERPPADYPFSDPKQYWPVVVYTDSVEVRQLLVAQALPGPLYGPVYYRVWVPEPLVPLLEQHAEVYRLAWNGDSRPDPGRAIPKPIRVSALGGVRQPDYPFSDPTRYVGVYVFTKSRAVRELVAAQALPSSHVYPGMVYGGTLLALGGKGFAAWVPEPLIPVLEAHAEVERLEWDGAKMPLGTVA